MATPGSWCPSRGTIDGARARAHAIGLVAPHGGGAIVIVATGADGWTDQHATLADTVAAGLEFFAPAVAAADAAAGGTVDWRTKLAGHCVAYMSSSGSSGPSFGGFSTGSYISNRSKLYLYPDGTFEGGSSSSASFDTGGGFGNVAGGNQNRGRWSIGAAGATATLELSEPDGSVITYELSTNERGHTFLDGDRWFVVSYQECADI